MQFNKLVVTLQSEDIKLGYHVRKFEIKEDRVRKDTCTGVYMAFAYKIHVVNVYVLFSN